MCIATDFLHVQLSGKLKGWSNEPRQNKGVHRRIAQYKQDHQSGCYGQTTTTGTSQHQVSHEDRIPASNPPSLSGLVQIRLSVYWPSESWWCISVPYNHGVLFHSHRCRAFCFIYLFLQTFPKLFSFIILWRQYQR